MAQQRVRIVEVAPRDGLQAISTTVPTKTKLELIRRLRDANLDTIEITSVVSPKAIPQLADCIDVLQSDIVRSLFSQQQTSPETLRLPVLVPNIKGLEIALQHGAQEVAVFVSATEGFSRANTKCSVEEGLQRAREVAKLARTKNIAVRG